MKKTDKAFKITWFIAATAVMFSLCMTSCSNDKIDEIDETIKIENIKVVDEVVDITIGEEKSLKYEITPTEAANIEVTWTSDNEEVATVDKNGNVKGIAKGTADITVKTKDGKYTSTCKVTVKKKITIYAAGTYVNKDNTKLKGIATIWINGEKHDYTKGETDASLNSVCVGEDGTVYGGGYIKNSAGNGVATVWTNGEPKSWSDGKVYAYINSIFVTKDNNVYAGGFIEEDDKRFPTLWRNGKEIKYNYEKKEGEIKSIYVDNGVLYAGGYIKEKNTNYPTVWEDGIAETYSNTKGEVRSICVANKILYAGGFVTPGSGYSSPDYPTVWKNGTANRYGEEGKICSIHVVGKDVYAGGSSDDGATVWINGKKEGYEGDSAYEYIYSIYVTEDGTIYAGGAFLMPLFWINGKNIKEGYDVGLGVISSIYVDE